MARKDEGEKVIFRQEWCKRCGICVAFCPRQAIAVGSDHQPFLAHPEQCHNCGLCERLCPDFAITIPGYKRKISRKRKAKQ